jgi:tRNA A37 threonylcarbamoyltransferase TsaD
MLSGGVSANLELRKQLEANVIKKLPFTNFCLPGLEYTTDNAAMIASAGYFKVRDKKIISWQKLKPDPNFDL